MPYVRHVKSRDGDVDVSGDGLVTARNGAYKYVNILLRAPIMLSQVLF